MHASLYIAGYLVCEQVELPADLSGLADLEATIVVVDGPTSTAGVISLRRNPTELGMPATDGGA